MPKGQTQTREQIIEALRRVDEGVRVGDVCRQLGIVEKTFHRWREKYAEMEAGEAKRLRELEDHNARLKKLLALVGLWARRGPHIATVRGDPPQRA